MSTDCHYLRADNSSYELTLAVDKGLPLHMWLNVGDTTLPLTYGGDPTEETEYEWHLESDPDWADGQRVKAVIFYNPWLEAGLERVW